MVQINSMVRNDGELIIMEQYVAFMLVNFINEFPLGLANIDSRAIRTVNFINNIFTLEFRKRIF